MNGVRILDASIDIIVVNDGLPNDLYFLRVADKVSGTYTWHQSIGEDWIRLDDDSAKDVEAEYQKANLITVRP